MNARKTLDSLFEVNNNAIYLHKFLGAGHEPDPYHYSYAITDWAEEEGVTLEDDHPDFDSLTPEEQDSFKEWLSQHQDNLDRDDPYSAPATSALSLNKNKHSYVAPTAWLIHFTGDDNVEDIARKGFQYGSDTDGLHLTTYRTNRNQDGPYAFAFEVGDRNMKRTATYGSGRREHKYGSSAVIFQSSAGVDAYHSGDEENQVIFDREHTRNRIPIYHSTYENTEYQIRDQRNDRVLFRNEDLMKTVNWAIAHFRQYARVIAFGVG